MGTPMEIDWPLNRGTVTSQQAEPQGIQHQNGKKKKHVNPETKWIRKKRKLQP